MHRKNTKNAFSISDNSDIEIMAEMRPKHLRTPPLVDLSDDDDEELPSTSTKARPKLTQLEPFNDSDAPTESDEPFVSD